MAKKKTGRKGKTPPPRCKASLLCEKTIIEAGTGGVSLIGIIGGFVVPQVPGMTRPFTAYLHLTDGIANHKYEITVEIHDLSNGTIIARATLPKVRWGDRLSRINLLIPVPPLQVQHAGAYDLVVFANQQEIDRQKFGVIIPVPPGPPLEEKGHD